MRTVIQEIASRLQARINCENTGNTEWHIKHSEVIQSLVDDLPSGSGIDNGTKIDLDRSTPDKIVFTLGFHHMNEGGMYDGWTDHEVIITPSLQFGFNMRITGRDRNQIKEYLHDTYYSALSAMPAYAQLQA